VALATLLGPELFTAVRSSMTTSRIRRTDCGNYQDGVPTWLLPASRSGFRDISVSTRGLGRRSKECSAIYGPVVAGMALTGLATAIIFRYMVALLIALYSPWAYLHTRRPVSSGFSILLAVDAGVPLPLVRASQRGRSSASGTLAQSCSLIRPGIARAVEPTSVELVAFPAGSE